MEAGACERVQHRGPGEGLGEEHDLGVLSGDLGEQPLPEVQGLGVRVVDAEDLHAARDPELDDPQHLLADALGIVVEVDRVDVLVLLRRVLGVRDRAVRPGREPVGVLGHPGVIGRALQGQVECDLETEPVGLGDERGEVLRGAEVRVDRVVPAGRAVGERTADRPRAARVVRAGGGRVVRPLAVRDADRVDRREVHDVEAHRRHGGKPGGGGAEGAARPGAVVPPRRAFGAREELVPGSDGGAVALDAQRFLLGDAGEPGDRAGADEARQARLARGGEALLRGEAGVQERRARLDARLGGAAREQLCTHREDQLEVLAGRDLDLGVVQPGGPVVGPRLHAPEPGSFGIEAHVGAPAVGSGGDAAHPMGLLAALRVDEHEVDAELAVALAERGRLEGDDLAAKRLGGPALLRLRGRKVANRDASDARAGVRGGRG